MKCPKCGKRLPDSAVICPGCGRHFKRSASNIAVVDSKKSITPQAWLTIALVAVTVLMAVLAFLPWVNAVSLAPDNYGEIIEGVTLYGSIEKFTLPWFFLFEILIVLAQILVLAFAIFGRKNPKVWPAVISLIVSAALMCYLFPGLIKTARLGSVGNQMSQIEQSLQSQQASSALSQSLDLTSSLPGESAPQQAEENASSSDYTFKAAGTVWCYIALCAAQLTLAISLKSAKKKAESAEDGGKTAGKRESDRNKLMDDLFNGTK